MRGFKLLRLGGSAFRGFVRDEYTTLPDLHNRPLHMWLDLEWTLRAPEAAFSGGAVTAHVRRMVREVFASFESGSIQQVIYQMGTKLLDEIPAISEVRLEANNRTWDTIAERGEELGVYTDARPPYGCLGLTLKRRVTSSKQRFLISEGELLILMSKTMARISTHVLDITRGTPAHGIAVELHFVKGAERRLIAAVTTNADGRTDQPLISGDQLETGIYELSFHAADYFHRLGVAL